MQTIDTIDYIVDPFYDLVENRDMNLELIERIVEYTSNNSEANTLVLVSSFNNYKKYLIYLMDNEKAEAVIEEHNKLYEEFINTLTKYAKHVFMGTKEEFATYGTDGEFDKLLEKNDLEFNPDKIEIFGHGLHRHQCVGEAVDSLRSALTKKHKNLDVDFTYEEDTSY